MANLLTMELDLDLTKFQNNINKAMQMTQNLQNSINGGGGNLKTSSIAAGVAFGEAAARVFEVGIRKSIEFAKDIIHTTVENQINSLRILNSSKPGYGESNVAFAKSEAIKYSMQYENVSEGYGRLLSLSSQSKFSNESINKLQDNILTAIKVYGINSEEVKPVIMDIGKQMAAGVLEGRVLRQLSQTGFGSHLDPFLAKQLGVTPEKFSQLLSSGKITKSAIPINVLLSAFDELAKSIRDKLPSVKASYESALNDLHNFWYDIKVRIGDSEGFKKFFASLQKAFSDPKLGDKLVKLGDSLFDSLSKLTDSINKFINSSSFDTIISLMDTFVSNLDTIVKSFVAYKGIMMASNLAGGISSAIGGIGGGGIVAAISAILPEVLAVGAVIAAATTLANQIMLKVGNNNNNSIKNNGRLNDPNLGAIELGMENVKNSADKQRILSSVLRIGNPSNPKTYTDSIGNMQNRYAQNVNLLNNSISGKDGKKGVNDTDLYNVLTAQFKLDYAKGLTDEEIQSDLARISDYSFKSEQNTKNIAKNTKVSVDSTTVRGVQPKIIHIDIHGNLVGSIPITTNTLGETSDRIVDIVTQAVLNGLAAGQQIIN